MSQLENQTFTIAPQYNLKNFQNYWGVAMVSILVCFVIAYLSDSKAFQSYALGGGVVFILIYFQSIKSRNAEQQKGWANILLTDGQLKITQDNSLLWSKEIAQLKSVELELKRFLSFSSKGLLIKSLDDGSYYINIPKPYSVEAPIELVVDEINKRIDQKNS